MDGILTVLSILADDDGFQTKMTKAAERKEGERRPLEPFPKVQVGGSSSSGRAPDPPLAAARYWLLRHLHIQVQKKDVVMDSAEVAIPLADGAHVTANVSSPLWFDLDNVSDRYKEKQR